MKQDCDSFTAELKLPKKGGRKKLYGSNAEKVAAYRARSGKATLTAQIDPALMKRLDDYMFNEKLGKRDETKSQVVERALANFFRKR